MKNLMFRMNSLWLGMCLLLSIPLIAQQLPTIIPMAPNAAEFSKYGTHPVNLSTGTPNISIPIYEINTGKIKVPISLSYHASGIKVTQSSTWVGLGWSLNAGGVISRTIRGKADEKVDGWFSDLTTTDQLVQSKDYRLVRNYAHNVKDPHPDIFSYNFGGKSGQFLFRKTTRSFATVPFDPIVIRRLSGVNLGDLANTYTIVDEDGITYYFEKKELFVNDNFGLEKYEQSWYLTKIRSYDKTDSVMFAYRLDGGNTGVQSDVLSFSTSRTYLKKDDESNFTSTYPDVPLGDPQSFNQTQHRSLTTHTQLTLSEIIFKQGKVVFEATTSRKDYNGMALDKITVYAKDDQNAYQSRYAFSFTYDYFKAFTNPATPWEYRLKLLSFQKQDNLGNQTEVHRFAYNPLNPPSTASCAQDYWGFYNGAETSNGTAFTGSLLPHELPNAPGLTYQYYNGQYIGEANRNPSDAHIMAGMLEKITYPTGGYTVFAYEPNKYKTENVTSTLINANLASLYLTGTGKGTVVSGSKSFTLPTDAYSPNCTMTIKLSAHTNPGAIDIAQRIILKNVTTGVILYTWEHPGDFTKPFSETRGFTLQPSHTYQLSGVVDDAAPTKVEADLTYQRINTDANAFIRSGGGIRIASISSYDGINALPSRQVYEYGTAQYGLNGLGMLLQSDLDICLNNYTSGRFEFLLKTGDGTMPCGKDRYGDMITYVGESVVQKNDLKGVPLIYGKVRQTQYNGAIPNGKTEYSFETLTDFTRVYNPTVAGGKEVIDNSFQAGKPQGEISYRYDPVLKTYALVHSKAITYEQFLMGTEESAVVYKKIIYTEPEDANPCGIESDPDLQYQQILRDFGVLERIKVKLKGIREKSLTETRYDGQGNTFTSSTSYVYGNTQHLFPTETSTTNSKGEVFRTVMKYPQDVAAVTPYTDLVSLNVLSPVIEQLKYKGASTFLQATRTNYQVWNGNAKQIYPETVETKLGSAAYEATVRHYAYDKQGNPQSFSKEQNVHNDFVWGYHSSLPIAQVIHTQTVTQQAAPQVQNTPMTADRLVQNNVATFEKFGTTVDLNIAQTLRFKIVLTDPVSSGWPAGAQLILGIMNSAGQVVTSVASPYYESYGTYDVDAALIFGNLPLGTYNLAVKLTNYPAGSTKRVQVHAECTYQYLSTPVPSQYYFHTSFEDEQFARITDAKAQTGRKSHMGPFQLPVLIPPGQYVLSYWQKTSLSADWTYVQQALTGSNNQPTISVPTTYVIDEVRLHLVGAQMTTYTYDPLLGMSSSTDVTNVTTYYEYDGLGRLKRLKDQEGNILKQYVYHYQGE